ncbi:MAG: Arabinose-5-phosphate isomerase [Caulobacteraceae bacterium]|nr:Arabinose-5-phosphate isomerase [Caulobacteraceae bacterium]
MHATPKIGTPAHPSASAVRTVEAEIEGLRTLVQALETTLEAPLRDAIDTIAQARGRVVVTGMGKSGHVARKIAATLASTGTPAFYLHPGEASHGDLGMIAAGDVALALSWSGETPELRAVIHYCKRFAIPLIAVSSEAASALVGAADVALVLPKAEEACPNGLAPTTSTTMQLAFGDALAMALLEARGFSAADFRNFHPGGRLGSQLVTVADLMATGGDVPTLPESATLSDAIFEITRGRYGGAAVVDVEGRLVGAFTDGDLRRALPKADLSAPVADHMNRAPVFVDPHLLATEALRVMNERPRPIMLIFACERGRLVGAVHMHDLLRAGVA